MGGDCGGLADQKGILKKQTDYNALCPGTGIQYPVPGQITYQLLSFRFSSGGTSMPTDIGGSSLKKT